MNAYDRVPYTSFPYDRTHPERLHALGALFGLTPAPVTACRVLELGCAAGGNLAPLAELLPHSTFIGVDRSAKQIAEGQAFIERLELPNLELRHADILDIDTSWGTFDYIVCHGVYSWVPQVVQAKILDIFAQRLHPHGLGYVSYNVYPGWHMREMVRDMMRYHVRTFDVPEHKVEQSRYLLEFMGRHVSAETSYGRMLHDEIDLLGRVNSDYLFHEHLEEDNRPLYFHQFASALETRGLSYVGETDLHTMMTAGLPAEVGDTLHRIATDIIALEQYMDFVRNRQFRASVIAHASRPLRRDLNGDHIAQAYFSYAPQTTEQTVDFSPGVVQSFATLGGQHVSSDRALTKAAFVVLGQAWPAVLSFEQVVTQARALVSAIPRAEHRIDPSALGADLLTSCFGGGVQLHGWQPPIATAIADRPRTTRVARAQAIRGSWTTTLHHRTLGLGRAQAQILRRLDGQHTCGRILDNLLDLVVDGQLDLTVADQPIRDRQTAREPLQRVLDEILTWLARQGMLIQNAD